MRTIIKLGHIPPKKIIAFTCGYCGTIFTEDFDPGVIYTSSCPICGKPVVFVEESTGLYIGNSEHLKEEQCRHLPI